MPAKGTVARGVTLSGPDMKKRHVPGGAVVDRACPHQCRITVGCAAVVMIRGVCHLKRSVGKVSYNDQARIWINPRIKAPPKPKEMFQAGGVAAGDLTGPNLREIRSGRIQDCIRECRFDAACRAAVQTRDGRCFLKRGLGRAKDGNFRVWVRPTGDQTVARPIPLKTRPYCIKGKVVAPSVGYFRWTSGGSIKRCNNKCMALGGRCAFAEWYPPERACRLYESRSGDDARRRPCTSWAKPAAVLAAQRKKEAEERAHRANPKGPKPTHPACRGHKNAFPSYRLIALERFYRPGRVAGHKAWPGRWITVEDGRLALGHAHKSKAGSHWYIMTNHDGTVHVHNRKDPNKVLLRKGGRVVFGTPNRHARWWMEHSFEHHDEAYDGFVLRAMDQERFLWAGPNGPTLGYDSEDKRAHWRYSAFYEDRDPRDKNVELVFSDPKDPPLDMTYVWAMTDWVIKEYAQSDQPVCWRRSGGDCDETRKVDCGPGMCGVSAGACVEAITEMVISTAELIATIAAAVPTGGTGGAAIGALKKAGQVARKIGTRAGKRMAKRMLRKAMKKGARALAKQLRGLRDRIAIHLGKQAMWRFSRQGQRETHMAAETLKRRRKLMTREIMLRAGERLTLAVMKQEQPNVMEIMSVADPTGVVSVIDAFYKPLCGDTPFPK